jgi:hypothetical protein
MLVAASGCGGKGPGQKPVISPSAVASNTPAPKTVLPPCPVANDACRLAAESLAVLQRGDGRALGNNATKQKLTCPAATPAADDVIGVALATVCQGRPPAATVEVYEFHTGKGPVYFLDLAPYVSEVSKALTSATSDRRHALSVIAVGCGAIDPTSSLDCGRAVAAVYAVKNSQTPSLPPLALIFTRASESQAWRIEKVWTPFPGVVPVPVPPGLRVEIYSAAGIRMIRLYPHDAE